MSNKCQAVNKSNGNDCNLSKINGDYCNKHKDYIKSHIYGTNGITITFGDQAENHKGMQIIGSSASVGYNLEDFNNIIDKCKNIGISTELVDLKKILNTDTIKDAAEAYVLIIRNGIDYILKDICKTEKDLYDEHINLKWDSKALMYGKVVDKKARHNLCYGDNNQEPDYASGKGRIISFDDVQLTKTIKNKLHEYFGNKSSKLVAEGNLYYNVNYNGIGFHGDSERKIVIAIRLGNTFPLRYQWYYDSKPVGEFIDINLNSGDIYIMSEKAVGQDWKLRKTLTLRHAAGCDDYITVQK